MDTFRTAFERAVAGWAEAGEAVLETGVEYRPGEPVVVHVRKRGRRWDFDDGGRAVDLPERPGGCFPRPSAWSPRRG